MDLGRAPLQSRLSGKEHMDLLKGENYIMRETFEIWYDVVKKM